MKILITGALGQLGLSLKSKLNNADSTDVYALSRSELDITDEQKVYDVIQNFKPEAVIHTAAYTAVDLAEKNKDEAYRINVVGTRNVALAAKTVNAKICYISTDYVFSGKRNHPYTEFEHTNPVNIYGLSKHAGETIVQTLTDQYFIVRTSWLYSSTGKNFFNTMIRLAQSGKSLNVVNDQFGTPTYTEDLSVFLIELVKSNKYGIYHATNKGYCSWYDFARAIFEELDWKVNLSPCSTEEYHTSAPRPSYSVLDQTFLKVNGFQELRPWREGLKACLKSSLQTRNQL